MNGTCGVCMPVWPTWILVHQTTSRLSTPPYIQCKHTHSRVGKRTGHLLSFWFGIVRFWHTEYRSKNARRTLAPLRIRHFSLHFVWDYGKSYMRVERLSGFIGCTMTSHKRWPRARLCGFLARRDASTTNHQQVLIKP